MADEFLNVLICDLGSHECKIGFSKEESVRMTIPTTYTIDSSNNPQFNSYGDNQLIFRNQVKDWEKVK